MDEEYLAKHERSRIQCRVNALKSVNKMDLPKVMVISDDSFSGLGINTSRNACIDLERLRKAYGDKLPYLIGLSLRETWFALFVSSGYLTLMRAEDAMAEDASDAALAMVERVMGDNDYMPKLATAEGYGEIEGFAWTLYSYLSELETPQQATFRDGTPFEERLPLGDILKGAAMYWFAAAATSYRAGNVEVAFDCLSEAQEALFLANGDHMWDEGAKLERESAKENSVSAVTAARTAFAKAGAQARHTETRNMKAEVFKWLDTQMENYRSMDAAARAITKQQPIVFGTAQAWVSEWKKLRSAGTP